MGEHDKAVPKPGPALPANPTEGSSPSSGSGTGDTSFFMSRGGRQLMIAPMTELLAITERLIAQARALGRESMVPEFQKIADATQRLIDKFNRTQTGDTILLKLSPMLSTLTGEASAPDSADGCKPRAGLETLMAGPGPANAPRISKGTILLVDDDTRASAIVALLLEHQGYVTQQAASGDEALRTLKTGGIDLVLLDILLPEVNGFQVLQQIRADPTSKDIPVVILSGLSDMDTVVKCIEMGADDYLPKPFNPVLLRARVDACLEKKRLRDQQVAYLKELQSEREKSDRLLLNILPAPIAARLKQGESRVVDSFPEVTVLFADLADFTNLAAHMPAAELVDLLNEVFSTFDGLVAGRKLEKIKTIGDAYMVVGGLPTPRPDHAASVADLALDMMRAIEKFNARRRSQYGLRIGVHTGPVIAGIIGQNKFAYDLWGSTVNLASRMESHGQVGSIQTTAATYERLKAQFRFQPRGSIEIKGIGEMPTYFLQGRA